LIGATLWGVLFTGGTLMLGVGAWTGLSSID